ncbi:MAG: helix-turn-helix domain-containing protein [Alphaproteobacteria bacterium]|nr:helix-turn-helix domain-containing protein [Alphaproteobacteria bacterium]
MIMRKKSLHGPNPVDVYVGKRMRMRRTLLGLSQEELGKALGVTFQQVQKYERGTCRVGASRLWDIGQALNTPVAFFYEGLEDTEGFNAGAPNGVRVLAETTVKLDENMFNRRETLELVRNYYKITDRNMAKKIAELIKSMASSDEQDKS